MRARTVALISDVHGNVEALRAVLGALENDSWVELVVAGDIVSRCLHDAECIDLLRDLRCVAIAGNSDVWVATNDHPGARGDPNRNRPGENGIPGQPPA